MKKLTLCLSLSMAAAGASAQVLTFDNVPFTQFQANWNGYELENLPSFGQNYGGLRWSDEFRVLRATGYADRVAGTPVNNGYTNGLVSGDFVAFNGGGVPVSFEALTSDGLFNFDSVYLGAAWYEGMSVQVQGFRDGVQVNNRVVTGLSYADSTRVSFNWTALDRVSFTSLETPAGTALDDSSTYNRAFVMDNLSISPVPEPTSAALLLAGLGLLGALARRRRA